MGRTVKSQTESKGQKTALLLGFGYCARALLPKLLARGYDVFATQRSPDDKTIDGVTRLEFSGEITTYLETALKTADILISSIPPGDDGDPFLTALDTPLTQAAPHLSWAGYLSATSVYGDRNGQWVFEDELCYPATQRGRNRVEAELAWLETGAPVHVFRLAGIYGPQILGVSRNPLSRIKAGKARAIIKPGHIVNRIHVNDIASAVMASIDAPNPVRIYNLADDTPAPPQDVINYAADLMGESKPPQLSIDDADISDMARSFYGECKRVSNARAKAELDWQPTYANYREGLTSIWQTDFEGTS